MVDWVIKYMKNSWHEMKNEIRYTFFVVIIVIGCSGCSPTTPIAVQTASTSENPLPTIIFTATRLPNITPPPTPEYPKPITPHVTPFPTITHADAAEDLTYMLQTNGDCEFPCFWGILPEITRYEKLYSVIDNLGGYRFENLQANDHVRVASSFGLGDDIGVQVEFQADLQNDIVQDLKVLLRNLWKTEVTPEDWSAYNMDEILRTYGVPDKVEVYLGGGGTLSFLVRLKYESLDTFIDYDWFTTEDKYLTPSSAIFCPEEIVIDSVELHMGKNPFNASGDGVPLIEATGLNEQDFHKLFTENPSACLTLNREAMGW